MSSMPNLSDADQVNIIGSVERRIAAAIAKEAFDRKENIGFTMRRWGYGLRQFAMRAEIAKHFSALRSPPPSPARQRAMNSQLAKGEQ